MLRSSAIKFLLLALLCVLTGALSGCGTTRWFNPGMAPPGVIHSPENTLRLSRAEHAYLLATELESVGDERCVESYFEAATASWCEVEQTLGCVDPTSLRASQLYHSSLAKLLTTAHRFGRFDPLCGLRIHSPQGEQQIAIQYHRFLWQAEDFNELLPAGDYSSDRLLHKYRNPGLGVPLVVLRKRNFAEPTLRRVHEFAATAVLQPRPEGRYTLELFDPVRVTSIDLNGEQVPLCRDLTAPLAYRAAEDGNLAFESFRSVSATQDANGLHILEPYQPGKIPLILVHGLLSDPTTWTTMVNELHAQPDIRARYQIWLFEYPTGESFVRSALSLREELAEAIALFDPAHQDPAMDQMVIAGHSMGGLLAKLQVTSSRTDLWDSISNRPFDQIVGSDHTLDMLARSLFFEPQTAIKRVVFIATPHRGAGMAQRTLGRIGTALIEEPPRRRAEHQALVANNPDAFSPEFRRRVPTSIDLMEPDSRVLQAVEDLPFHPCVTMHSVIGNDGCPIGRPSDGVVPVSSARHSRVASERYVCSEHTEVQCKPDTIDEMLRILRLHAERVPNAAISVSDLTPSN